MALYPIESYDPNQWHNCEYPRGDGNQLSTGALMFKEKTIL